MGSFVKAQRKKRGWSQRKLAWEAHIGISTISLWETGKKTPSSRMLSKLQEIFSDSYTPREKPEPPDPFLNAINISTEAGRNALKPSINFVEGKKYYFARKTKAEKTAETIKEDGNLEFVAIVKGDRWIMHYLFKFPCGSFTTFTQLQLRDYIITALA